MVDSEENELVETFFPSLLPRLLTNLTFTEEDARRFKEDIEVENNPYAEDEEDPSVEDDLDEENRNVYEGFTIRKLSAQLI